MLTPWMLCLLLVVPLIRGGAMWRTWSALMLASLAGKAFPFPTAWVLIDLVAAVIVIFPPRKGFQKAIAWLFAVMMLFELGWLMSAQMNLYAVVNAGTLCGWLQLAVLATWGLDERGGLYCILDWVGGPWLARYAVTPR